MRAQITPPTAAACSIVFGWNTYSPVLFLAGPGPAIKVKSEGFGLICTSTAPLGADQILWAQFKAYLTKPGPNTCANAGLPGYTGKIHIKWHLQNSNSPYNYYNRTSYGPLTALTPTAFTSTWSSQGLFPGPIPPVNIHIDGTNGPTVPATGVGTGCNSPNSAGGVVNAFIGPPSNLSFP